MPRLNLVSGSRKFTMDVLEGESCVVALLSNTNFIPFVAKTVVNRLDAMEFDDFEDIPPELLIHHRICSIEFLDKDKFGKSFSVLDSGKEVQFLFNLSISLAAASEDTEADFARIFGDLNTKLEIKFALRLNCIEGIHEL